MHNLLMMFIFHSVLPCQDVSSHECRDSCLLYWLVFSRCPDQCLAISKHLRMSDLYLYSKQLVGYENSRPHMGIGDLSSPLPLLSSKPRSSGPKILDKTEEEGELPRRPQWGLKPKLQLLGEGAGDRGRRRGRH